MEYHTVPFFVDGKTYEIGGILIMEPTYFLVSLGSFESDLGDFAALGMYIGGQFIATSPFGQEISANNNFMATSGGFSLSDGTVTAPARYSYSNPAMATFNNNHFIPIALVSNGIKTHFG
jgi:hypothetical protein